MIPTASQPVLQTKNAAEQLVLRDIHLPDAVSWWPLAPGWWALLALVVVLLIAALAALHRRKQRRYQRIALCQLTLLEKNFNADGNQQQLLQEISKLLRHMAVLHFPPQQCAGLCGEPWLQFLDRTLSGKKSAKKYQNAFSCGIGRCLAEAPYQSQSGQDKVDNNCDSPHNESMEVIQLSRCWIKGLPPRPHHRRSA